MSQNIDPITNYYFKCERKFVFLFVMHSCLNNWTDFGGL